MKRTSRLLLGGAAVVSSLLGSAFGGGSVPARAALPAAARQDVLVLRAGTGPQAALEALPGDDQRAARLLPLGLLDRAGRTLYVATVQGGGRTLIRALDVVSGRTLRALSVAGTYSTRTGDYRPATSLTQPPARTGLRGIGGPPPAPAGLLGSRPQAAAGGGVPADTTETIVALSYNGRWLALRDTTVDVSRTHVVVIDTAGMRLIRAMDLPGQFGLDAISADGTRLYLIEPLYQYGPDAYQVRSFEVQRGVLDAAPVIEKGEKPGSMNGTGWTRAWSPDGTWLFTLYVQQNGNAFIHALNLVTRQVHCIDLPHVQVTPAELAHYTLSVAPDGSALYAANPLLGRLVAARGGLPFGQITLVDLKVQAGAPRRPQAGAALSSDGRRLYIATGSGAWVLDTRTLTLRGIYLSGRDLASLALSRDGSRLYALGTDRRLSALAAATGEIEEDAAVQPDAWAIEGVATAK